MGGNVGGRQNITGMRKILCKLTRDKDGSKGALGALALPGVGPAPPKELGNTVGLVLQPHRPFHSFCPCPSSADTDRWPCLGLFTHSRRCPRGGTAWEQEAHQGLWVSGLYGEQSCMVLLDRLHHQDFALALGNLVQRQHSLVWRQVEGAADRGSHRGRDGPALHHTARPGGGQRLWAPLRCGPSPTLCSSLRPGQWDVRFLPHEVAAGRLLVGEGLRAAQAGLVSLH